MIDVLIIAGSLSALGVADVRWWRVAQREHYLPGSVSLFARRWWLHRPVNLTLSALTVGGLVLSQRYEVALFVTLACIGVGPIGLSLRGRTSKLVWTRRLQTIAAVTIATQALLVVALVMGLGATGSVVVAMLAFVAVDLALAILQPFEKRKAARFVDRARKRLSQVAPKVVGITGSYGKTSTKNYLAHLVTGTRTVLPTPASFNNRAGLSRSINEQLTPGTEVFIAEMGTYGRGEIRELCEFVEPEIAMITAIGPVHLERFKSEDVIVEAKAEIFEKASVCILNIDDVRLRDLAERLRSQGKRVRTVASKDTSADVCVVETDGSVRLTVDGIDHAEIAGVDAAPTNVACAIAAALELGVSIDDIVRRLPSLPVSLHRQSMSTSDNGVVIIDDTYNANPASVRRGLALLAKAAGVDRRRVVVTPGMVELGNRQAEENRRFGEEAAVVATDLVFIGATNRRALLDGARQAGANVVVLDRLPQATEWVREQLGEGDAVLYANDLPDHFP